MVRKPKFLDAQRKCATAQSYGMELTLSCCFFPICAIITPSRSSLGDGDVSCSWTESAADFIPPLLISIFEMSMD